MTGLLRSAPLPLTQRYAAGLVLDGFKYAVFVLAGAEAIFLSDALIANLLPEVLRHQAKVVSLLELILFTIPPVLTIALPLALLVGTYMAVINRRQVAEFAVLAGIGRSSRSLIALASVIGVGGLTFSLLMSDFADPLARYQLKRTIFDIRFDAIREGKIAAGRFYQFGDFSVFASSGRINEVASNFFVHERVDDTTDRIIVANRTTRVRVPERPNVGLILEDVAIHEFARQGSNGEGQAAIQADCVDCESDDVIAPFQLVSFDRLFVEFPAADLPPLAPRSSQRQDWTSFELLRQGWHEDWAAAIFADRLLRGILCLMAPLLGLLAVTLTNDRTYLVALPVAGAAVLCGEFFGSFAVERLSSLGMTATLGVMGAATVATGALLVMAIRNSERGLVQPLGVRV